jgi:hypothetical protein
VRSFYSDHGFTESAGGDEERVYLAELAGEAFAWPDVIARFSTLLQETAGG